jgi:ABC-type glycerol-3-phosphate transport system substrate-binding protein
MFMGPGWGSDRSNLQRSVDIAAGLYSPGKRGLRLAGRLAAQCVHGTLASAPMKTPAPPFSLPNLRAHDPSPALNPRSPALLGTLLVGLALSASLVGCAGRAAAPSATPAGPATAPPPTAIPATPSETATAVPGKVSIWLEWSPAEMRALDGIIEEYREMHPGLAFEIVYQRPGTLKSSFELAVQNDEAVPSMLIGSSEWGSTWAEESLIRDVSAVVLPEHQEALHAVAWEQVERDGFVTGLPLELQGTVLYRNTSLAPEPAVSVDALLTAAEEARASGRFGASFDLGFRRAAPLLKTCKGELVADERVDPVGRPQGLCWLRLLNRLGTAGPVTIDSEEDLERFLAGQSMWLLDSTEEMLRIQEELGAGAMAVDPWPLYGSTGEPLAGYVWTENAYFPAAASDQDFEAAWSFAVHLLAAENQRLLSDTGGVRHLPVHREVAPSDALAGQALRVLLAGTPLPDQEAFGDIMRELETAIRLVVLQGGDPDLALDLALNEIREARIPTETPTRTPTATITPTPSRTPFPSPPPG